MCRRLVEGNYAIVALDVVHLSCTITVTPVILEEKEATTIPPAVDLSTEEAEQQVIPKSLPSSMDSAAEEPEPQADAKVLPSTTGPIKSGTGYK
jgi:hypothetical protein